MVLQFYEYAKTHCSIYFKWVICVVCELYLNKMLKNIKTRSMVLNPGHTLQSLEGAKKWSIPRVAPATNYIRISVG